MKRLLLLVCVLSATLSTSAYAQTTVEAGKPYNLTAPHDCANVTGYNVYVDGVQAGATLPASACASGTVTSPTLPGLTAGVHKFLLSAVNALGEAKGAELTATAGTLPTPPGLPTIKVTTVATVQIGADGIAKVLDIIATAIALPEPPK